MKLGEYHLQINPCALSAHGQTISLRNNSLSVLEVLASKPFQVVSREELLDRIWPNAHAADENLSQCIRDIRRAINDKEKEIIQTVYKRGYRLNPDSDELVPLPEIEYGDAVPYQDYPKFKQTTGFTKASDGVGIAYASSGKGPVVIRAPHWLCHLDWDWKCGISGPRIRRFSEKLNFIRFDSRGTGRSDRNVDPGSVDQWCEDMHAVATANGHDKFALMGVSAGGLTCFKYALKYPNRVSCIVLIGGYCRGPLNRGVSLEQVAALSKLIESGWGCDNESIRQIMTTQLWPSATKDQIASFNHLQQVSSDGATAAKMLLNLSHLDFTDSLEKITQPTLIVHSRYDFRIPLAEAELVSEKIPNATLRVLESKNHTPLSHEPEFNRMIDGVSDFIISHSG